jgi:hypothetical protein
MARKASADRLVGDAVEVLALKRDHLERAVAAMRLADAAERLARVEVMRARELDGATWADVGEALVVRPQTAHERFRSGTDGLHSRFDKRQGKSSGSAMSATSSKRAGEASRRSSAARRAAAARS